MVIAKDSLTGNCRRIKETVEPEGISGMRGTKTLSPAYRQVHKVASMTLGQSRVMVNFVPLQSLGASMLRRSIMGAPTLSRNVCDSRPGGLSELRTSVG